MVRATGFLAITVAAALAVLVGVVIGRATAAHIGGPPAAVTVDGIPLQTVDTRAGAVAAADNALAIASQTVEQDAAAFAQLVAVAYAPTVRAGTLAQAARLRAGDPVNMANYRAGGRAVALVAARRLDAFSGGRASVTTWLGGFVWGPHLAPRQSWNLVRTTLAFEHGRWLVRSSSALATPAPVPSIVFVNGHNNQTAAFNTRLAGMTAPFYGTG
jgi:hypothetical protein